MGILALQHRTNPAPELSEKGEPGQELNVILELKVLADVGLVGFPSVGKSTLLSVVSAAKPKIGAYHFTTIVPNLGMIETEDITEALPWQIYLGLLKERMKG